jgi:hypothetical protein
MAITFEPRLVAEQAGHNPLIYSVPLKGPVRLHDWFPAIGSCELTFIALKDQFALIQSAHFRRILAFFLFEH